MFKEDDKEVEEIMGRVSAYLREVVYDDLTENIKTKEGFKLPSTLTCIRLEK